MQTTLTKLIPGIDYTGVTVVFACHDGLGNFLFNLRSINCRDEQHKWDCVGGKLEMYEEPVAALHRKVNEEYCCNIVEWEFLGFRSVVRATLPLGKTHWLALDYKALVDRSQVRIGERDKTDAIAWFKLGTNVPHIGVMHSAWPDFFERYRDKLLTSPKPRKSLRRCVMFSELSCPYNSGCTPGKCLRETIEC